MSSSLLIFDLDGTLIDSRQDLATAVNLMRRHYDLPPLPVEAISGYVGHGVRHLVQRALQGTTIDPEDALRLQRQFYAEHLHDDTVLYPGVHKTLQTLADRRHLLTVATNKPVSSCEILLDHFQVRLLFRIVAGDGSGLPLKPDPAMILQAVHALRVPPARTWVIGDNHTDLEAARRAGVRSVFLSYGIGGTGTEHPDLTCATFTDLLHHFH
jgi:phosphoglycolate phosphatase